MEGVGNATLLFPMHFLGGCNEGVTPFPNLYFKYLQSKEGFTANTVVVFSWCILHKIGALSQHS